MVYREKILNSGRREIPKVSISEFLKEFPHVLHEPIQVLFAHDLHMLVEPSRRGYLLRPDNHQVLGFGT